MKKLIAIILVITVAFSLCTTVFADYQPLDLDNGVKDSILNISGTTATCVSQISTFSTEISSIKITQTLEKQGFLWTWGKYDGDWSKTLTKSGALTTKVYNLSSGNYRVKSVFVVTLQDGRSQTITLYSDEKSVP